MKSPPTRVRLDKWLWAARFFKTRSQSSAAIKGGKVDVEGSSAKPGQQVQVGTNIQVRKGPYRWSVEVTGLAERRGNAELAATLYREDPASAEAREATHARIGAERADMRVRYGQGRPTKKQRRELVRFKLRTLSPESWPLDDEPGDDDDDRDD